MHHSILAACFYDDRIPLFLTAIIFCFFNQVLYWVDFSLPSHLPELFYDLFKSFRLETLPGSPLCLHHFTPVEGRPFLVCEADPVVVPVLCFLSHTDWHRKLTSTISLHTYRRAQICTSRPPARSHFSTRTALARWTQGINRLQVGNAFVTHRLSSVCQLLHG